MKVKKYQTLVLLNTGQILLFDNKGEQVSKYQGKFHDAFVNKKPIDRALLKKLAQNSQNIYFGKFREFLINLTEEEFIRLFCE